MRVKKKRFDKTNKRNKQKLRFRQQNGGYERGLWGERELGRGSNAQGWKETGPWL